MFFVYRENGIRWYFGKKNTPFNGESTKVVFYLLFYPIYGIIPSSLAEYKGAELFKSEKSEKIDRLRLEIW